jgi:hypothetical protein
MDPFGMRLIVPALVQDHVVIEVYQTNNLIAAALDLQVIVGNDIIIFRIEGFVLRIVI